jgi:hypothetical protein
VILYVLRRLLQLVPVFLCASFLIFSIIHLLPGDPAQVMLGEERYDEAQYQLLRKKLGLDRPFYVQYFSWLDRLVRGDLGQSLRTQRGVLETVAERYPATIYLALASLILGIVIAIPAGTLAAVRQNTLWDYSAMSFALLGIAVPNFWFALVLILGFGLYLGWFPTVSLVSHLARNRARNRFGFHRDPLRKGGNARAVEARLRPHGAGERRPPEMGHLQTYLAKLADRSDHRHRPARRPIARRINRRGNYIRLARGRPIGARGGLRARLSAPPRSGAISCFYLRDRESFGGCILQMARSADLA